MSADFKKSHRTTTDAVSLINCSILLGVAHSVRISVGGGSFGEPEDRGRARRRCIMNTMDRITITLTPEMAQAVRGAVEAGEYASSSEIIRKGEERLKGRDASA